MSHLDDDNILGFHMPNAQQVSETVSLISQVAGLLKLVYDWWTKDRSGVHVSASLKALDVLLETRPNLRAQLAEQARQDPATAEQLRALATDDHPGLMATVKEI